MALSKDQLIGDIAEATDLEKSSVRNVLEQLSQIVADALENDGEITLPGIGKLKVSERPARTLSTICRQTGSAHCQGSWPSGMKLGRVILFMSPSR